MSLQNITSQINQASHDKAGQPSIDFAPLDAAHTPKAPLMVAGIGVAIFVIFIIAVAAQSNQYQGSVSGDLAGSIVAVILIFGIICMFAGLVLTVWLQSRRQKAAFAEFIVCNGWSSFWSDGVNQHTPTSLLGAGRDQHTTEQFSGSYRNTPFAGGMLSYVTGSGKSQQTYSFALLNFQLQQEYPLIVLDDKKNNNFLIFSDLPERIPGGHELQVEGDFNNRFKITVMPGTEQDVLQLLTPDILDKLLHSTAIADIEIEANQLYVITGPNEGQLDARNLRNLFAMSDVMLEHLTEESSTWQASSSPETLQAIETQALAPRLQILQHAHHIAIGSIIGLILYFLVQVIPVLIARH